MDSCEVRSIHPLFREVAGYLNTAHRPPANFPRRVLYGCALPGHNADVKAQITTHYGGGVRCEGVFSTVSELYRKNVTASTRFPELWCRLRNALRLGK